MKKSLLIAAFGLLLAFSPSFASATTYGFNNRSYVNFTTDTLYWNSVGLGKPPIRMYLPPPTNTPYVQSVMDQARVWHNAGHFVSCGVSESTATPVLGTSTWQAYHDATIVWGEYVQRERICDWFEIGNELEFQNDGSLTSSTIRSNVRQLATDVISAITAISVASGTSRIPIGYSIAGTTAFGKGMQAWLDDAAGIGDMDFVGMNFYFDAETTTFKQYSYSSLITARARYGDKLKITEFNIDSGTAGYYIHPEAYRTTQFRYGLDLFKKLGIDKVFIYQWRGFSYDPFFLSMIKENEVKILEFTNAFERPITVVHNFGS